MAFKFIGVNFIVFLVIVITIMKKQLDSSIKCIDRFDRPSLNRDINYAVLCLCLLSCLIGCVVTLIMLKL